MEFDIRDAAKLLGIPEKKIYSLIKHEKLPCSKAGLRYRFNRTNLIEWATEHKIPLSADVFKSATDSNLNVSLSDALDRGGVFYKVPGNTKEDVLMAVVNAMPLAEGTDRPALLQMLLAREALGTTAIGGGIAMPHVRNPLILSSGDPAMTLCFLDKPIDFGAPDGQLVDTLFTIISPSVPVHLALLARLAFALREQNLLDALRKRENTQTISAHISRIQQQASKEMVS